MTQGNRAAAGKQAAARYGSNQGRSSNGGQWAAKQCSVHGNGVCYGLLAGAHRQGRMELDAQSRIWDLDVAGWHVRARNATVVPD